MTRFEVMSEAEAQRIVDDRRRALAAILRGDSKSADARAASFQSEMYEDAIAATRTVLRTWRNDGWSPPPLRYFERCGHCNGTKHQHGRPCGMCRGRGYFESERVR